VKSENKPKSFQNKIKTQKKKKRKKNYIEQERMALWMEAGADPMTDKEKADIDAIAALKESSALELKVLLLVPLISIFPSICKR
jgi:hypothetical protein